MKNRSKWNKSIAVHDKNHFYLWLELFSNDLAKQHTIHALNKFRSDAFCQMQLCANWRLKKPHHNCEIIKQEAKKWIQETN